MTSLDLRPRHVLIVEDEQALALGLSDLFSSAGYAVSTAVTGEQATTLCTGQRFDIVVLDVLLPGRNGFDVCAELRKARVTTPIIMVTARTQDAEKELGLDSGADDYVTKPFSMRELRARVRAQLRRASRDRQAERVIRFGDCEIDFDRAELRRSGRLVDVTAQELRLLNVFLQNRGRVLSRDQLITAAWGPGMAITDRAVDTHVFNLRRKIEPEPSEPRFLLGVRGLGYRFEDEDLINA